MVPSFPGYSLDVAYTLWMLPFELVPRQSASGFPEAGLPLWESNASESCVTQHPIVAHFSQSPQQSCHRFLFLFGNSSLALSFLFGCSSTLWCGKRHLSPFLQPFLFCRICTRADANIHKAFVCKYSSNNIYTVVGEWHHGYLCLGYFSSPTQFDLVTRMAQKGWRQCDLVFVHDRHSHTGNCIAYANTGLFLSTGNKYLFLLQQSFRLFITAPDEILPCLASKFRNRSFSSILLFTVVFNFW